MGTFIVPVIAVVAIAVIVGVLAIAWENRRRQELRSRFGPEYDRTLGEYDKRRQAERELAHRAGERDKLDIHPLTPAARDRYAMEWRDVQARFVDGPSASVGEADALVTRVLRARGYPVEDFDSKARIVSVDHPAIVTNYRSAHDVYLRDQQGEADTDDLRGAVVDYRSLFEDLLVDEDEGAAARA